MDQTPVPQERIEELVAKWVRRFRIGEWTVRVEAVPTELLDDEARVGTMSWDVETGVGTMRVASANTPAEVEDTVIHELVHLLLADLECVFLRACDELSPSAARVSRAAYRAASERVVLRLAEALQGGDAA